MQSDINNKQFFEHMYNFFVKQKFHKVKVNKINSFCFEVSYREDRKEKFVYDDIHDCFLLMGTTQYSRDLAINWMWYLTYMDHPIRKQDFIKYFNFLLKCELI